MGAIAEINKLHVTAKGLACGFLFVMPIWFIDIFLFHKQLYTSNLIYIPIIFAFWLTCCYLIICIGIGIFVIFEDNDDDSVFQVSVLAGIVLLSTCTIIAYLMKLNFIQFALISFSSGIIILAALIIWRYYQKDKKVKK